MIWGLILFVVVAAILDTFDVGAFILATLVFLASLVLIWGALVLLLPRPDGTIVIALLASAYIAHRVKRALQA